MILFPSEFRCPDDISRLLYYAAIWSGGRTSEVRLQGFDTLRTHVNEISRSPSGGRVRLLSSHLNLLSGIPQTSIFLPPDIASTFYSACLQEAPALLELGYPRDEPALFTASLPSPAANSIRTRHQIRSAMHHLGGDFDLMKTLLRTADSTDAALNVSFSVWPPRHVRAGSFILRLGYSGQAVPAVMILDRTLLGYVLLCCWDLALRLRDTEKIPVSEHDFSSFSRACLEDISTDGN